MIKEEFFNHDDIQLILFSNELKEKIDAYCRQKVFITQNQVLRFIDKTVEQFLSTLNLRKAVRSVYTRELFYLINNHLSEIVKKYNLFLVY